MNIVKADNIACPIDGNKLTQQEKQFICDDGHAFDIARQGYVNLLPVQHKRSKQPGDSKAMVLARAHFLDTGIYQPIASMLTELVSAQLSDDSDSCILDAGCGEGYYFYYLMDYFSKDSQSNNLSFIGLDISKDAIIQATKRNKQTSWIVGTNRQPPVIEESIDIILCMFGFVSIDAFKKVLKPGGKIIMVDPGSDHLKELREIIYSEVKTAKKSDSTLLEYPEFSLVETKSLRFEKSVDDNEQINNLLLMTPHFYRASKQGKEAACELGELNITVDVVFKVYEKV